MSSTDTLVETPAAKEIARTDLKPESAEPRPAASEGQSTKSDGAPQRRRSPSAFKRGAVLSLILVSTAVVGVLATRPSVGDAVMDVEPAAEALPVSILRAGQLAAPELSRAYSGVLLARQESLLSFERGGRILTLDKREGDPVRAGEQLAELDQENLDAVEQRTRSELAAAEARLAELVAGPRQQTIDAARARVDQLAAEAALAKVDAERQNRLMSTNATSRAAFDTALYGLRASENALAAQRATLDELIEGTREEQIEIQRANLAGIQAALKEIEAQRRDSRIEAPFDGKIQSRLVDEGVVVSSGAAAFELVSHEIEARFGLPPDVAAKISPNTNVTIRLRDDVRQGEVDRVEPTVDRSTRTRGVYVRFNDLGDVAGRPADAWVAGELPELLLNEQDEFASAEDKFWLPTTSLSRAARGLWMVLVVPGEEPTAVCERRAVELLKTDGEHALVQGMISRDERVITGGLHRLTAGLLVEPKEPMTSHE